MPAVQQIRFAGLGPIWMIADCMWCIYGTVRSGQCRWDISRYARLDFKFQLLSSANADVYSGDKTILLGDKNPVVVAEMSGSVLDVENVSLSCTDGPRNLVRNSAVP